jgi:translation initiation factor IF-3
MGSFCLCPGTRSLIISKDQLRVNQQIRAREIRVIDEKGEQLGVMDPRDALRIAQERDLDLVEVSPQTKPPVCRMMDYGKWKYEAAKKNREAAKATVAKKKVQEIREVKLRPKIDEHDYQVKSKMVRRLLSEGDKVKVTMMFRGREVVHANIALKLLERVFNDAIELAIIENRPRLEGRNMIMVLAPKAGSTAGAAGSVFAAPGTSPAPTPVAVTAPSAAAAPSAPTAPSATAATAAPASSDAASNG